MTRGVSTTSLVFDAKRENVTKMVSSTRGGGVSSTRHRRGGVNDKGGQVLSTVLIARHQQGAVNDKGEVPKSLLFTFEDNALTVLLASRTL